MKKLFKLPDGFHGSGPIYFSWQKGHNGKYLVTTGYDQIVNLHDRYGNKVDSFSLSGVCCGLEWNRNGDLLALITDRSSVLKIWEANNRKVVNVDFALKETMNLVLWSNLTPNLLAITTTRGNLFIYDHNTSRKIPILGKHSKKIVSGCWSNQNLLALVSEDRYLTISDDSGDTIYQSSLKSKGSLVKASLQPIQFPSLRSETQTMIESPCISVVLDQKQVTLLPIVALDQPLILSFDERRDDEIFDYYWQENGQLLIAFSTGFVISVITTGSRFGQQLVNVKVFPDTISNLNFCEATGGLAVIRKNVIKLMNAGSLEQIDNVVTLEDEQELEWLEWSSNGQMLAVSSEAGGLNVFLMRLPSVSCTYQTKIAYLSSLLELTFIDIDLAEQERSGRNGRNRIQLDIEPTLIAICNTHLAACMNNRAYFYELKTFSVHGGQSFERIKEKEYSSIIRCMLMNDRYAAVLFTNGRAIVHRILEDQLDSDLDSGDHHPNHNDYQVDAKLSVVCIGLTGSFFIWCTDAGILELFSLDEWATVSVHRHTTAIRRIATDFLGLRILLVDENNEAFVFDATSEHLTPVELRRGEEEANQLDDLENLSMNYEELPTDRVVVGQRNYSQSFPFQCSRMLWDQNDHSMFAVIDKRQILIFYFVAKSVQGSFVQFVGRSALDEGVTVQLIHEGYVYSQTANGAVTCSQLETHNYSRLLARSKKNVAEKSTAKQEEMFHNLLKLRRTEDCWTMCKAMNRIEFWLQFIDCCLHDLNLSEAIRIARYIGHAGLVWSFKSIQAVEEWTLLAGHVAMYLQWFDLAERLYLKSSQPTCALRLRLDLMQWNACLVLAKRLASNQLPYIHKQQAQELEFEEDYATALEHYQDGLLERGGMAPDEDVQMVARHNQECLAGISRCLVKCNDRKKGVQIAMKLDDPELVLRTAQVCEECNLFGDAAALYEKTGELENASSLYLKTRNLDKVKELLQLPNKTNKNWPSKSVLVQYAKLQEADGKYNDAFRAYEQAGEQLDCVRLLLNKLKRPQEAVKLVRQQRKVYNSTEACLLIAKHFQQTNDYESAIEFLVYSGKLDEAFELALQESQMALYTSALLQILQSSSPASTELTSLELTDRTLVKQLQRIAIYYEEEHQLLNAGKFNCLAGQLQKGIKQLLRAHASLKGAVANKTDRSSDEDPLKLAIEFACKSNDESSIQQVIEVLISELDSGHQTDFQYLFKLYMCSGQYREATKTALLLAKEEQSNGNYDSAHGLLVEMCKNLLTNQLKISFELLSALHLLHCYKLAKLYLKAERLEQSCELLGRVSNSISKFPKHAAQILSTCVLENLKLGNKPQAIHFSSILLQNSAYLEQLDGKFRRKIETLIRKSASVRREPLQDAPAEDESVCPFCQSGLSKFQLSCNSCRNVVPFSILSGYHLTNEECYQCGVCCLPFVLTELAAFSLVESNCPACGSKLDRETITKLESLALVS